MAHHDVVECSDLVVAQVLDGLRQVEHPLGSFPKDDRREVDGDLHAWLFSGSGPVLNRACVQSDAVGRRTLAVAGMSSFPSEVCSAISSSTTPLWVFHRGHRARIHQIFARERAGAVLPGDVLEACLRSGPVGHILREPCALQGTVHEDVFVPFRSGA